MEWDIRITDEAKKEFAGFHNDIKPQILAGIRKVSKAPLPKPNGYGTPLGNKHGNNLTGFFKIKYKKIGIRVVYTLALEEKIMNIIVISKRSDEYCYELAGKLYEKYGDKIFKDIFSDF